MIRGYGLARKASRHELLGSWTTARFGNSACGGEAGLPEPFVAKVKALLPCKGLSAANFCSSCDVEGYRLQGFASRATLWTCYRCPKALQRPPFRMNRAFAVGIYAARRAKPCRKWPPTLHEDQNLALHTGLVFLSAAAKQRGISSAAMNIADALAHPAGEPERPPESFAVRV